MAQFEKKRVKVRKPTIMQIRALQYMAQGETKRQAMLKAGYSKDSADHPKNQLLKSKAIRSLIEQMGLGFLQKGATPAYWVDVILEASKATKIHSSHTEPDREIPDHLVRLKAYEKWKEVTEPKDIDMGRKKRELRITEYIDALPDNDTQT